jgi:lysophospholipase L1-like esterase
MPQLIRKTLQKAVIGFILTLLVMEVCSRLAVGICRAIYRRDMGWGMQAVFHGFQYNRINPPENAIPEKLNPTKKLIVCFGGSTTQGISGMDWQGGTYIPATSWCQFLQEKLGDQYHVLNLAKSSMMSNYHIQVIKQLQARNIRPYMAIWYAGINDAAVLIEAPRRDHESGDFKAVMDDNPEMFSTHYGMPPSVKFDAYLERYCFVYHLMGRGIRSFNAKAKITEDSILEINATYVQIAEANYRANLEKLITWCQQSNTKLVLCTEALPTKKSDLTGGGTVYCRIRAPLTFINSITEKFTGEFHPISIPLIFINTGYYIESLNQDNLIYLQDHVHFTPYGNQLIAEKLHQELFK